MSYTLVHFGYHIARRWRKRFVSRMVVRRAWDLHAGISIGCMTWGKDAPRWGCLGRDSVRWGHGNGENDPSEDTHLCIVKQPLLYLPKHLCGRPHEHRLDALTALSRCLREEQALIERELLGEFGGDGAQGFCGERY